MPARAVTHRLEGATMLDPVDLMRKTFLAGVGAVAYGAEKTGEIIDDLVKKGEITVDQGKDLNRELTQKAKQTVSDAQDQELRAHLATMTPAERADYVDRAREIADDLDAARVTVDVEAEDDEAEE